MQPPFPAGQAAQARGQAMCVVPDHEKRQHLFDLKAPQSEDERPQRRSVGPVGIVHHDDQRPGPVRAPDHLEQVGADRQGIAHRPIHDLLPARETYEELVQDPVMKESLRLVSARLEDATRVYPAQDLPQQRRLADPGRSLDENDPGLPGPRPPHLTFEQAQLDRPADERARRPRGLSPGSIPSRRESSVHKDPSVDRTKADALEPRTPRGPD